MAGRVWEVYLVRAKYLPLFLATRAVQTETLHAIFLLVVFPLPWKSLVSDGEPYSPAGQWRVKSSPCHSNVWSHPGGGRRRGSGPLLYEDVRILIDCTIDS